MEYYFPDDIWKIIEDFLIHNIKTQGKHLSNDKYVKQYNIVMEEMLTSYYEAWFYWFF